MHITIPNKIGKYERLEELGSGLHGVVYQAEHLVEGGLYAIKILRHSDQATIDRFTKEVKALNELRHPNIIQIYDYDVDGELKYFVMPYMNGGTLETWILNNWCDGRQPSIRESLLIAKQIALGLQCVHQHGYIHRDVKPNNIWLNAQDEEWVLGDFSIVKDVGRTTLVHNSKSGEQEPAKSFTPKYASWDQRIGRRSIGPSSDICQLGFVVHEILTGDLPTKGYTIADSSPDWSNPVFKGLPLSVRRLIKKMAHEDRNKRFQNADDLILAIDKILSANPDTPKLHQRMTRWFNKSLLGTILQRNVVAYALLGILAVTAIFLIMRSQNRLEANAVPTVSSPTITSLASSPSITSTTPLASSSVITNATPHMEPTPTLMSETPTYTATSTPTPQPVVARNGLLLQQGPGTGGDWLPDGSNDDYDTLGKCLVGTPVEILGRDSSGWWLYVEVPIEGNPCGLENLSENRGYMVADSIDNVSKQESLPIFTPPPTNTPVPTSTATPTSTACPVPSTDFFKALHYSGLESGEEVPLEWGRINNIEGLGIEGYDVNGTLVYSDGLSISQTSFKVYPEGTTTYRLKAIYCDGKEKYVGGDTKVYVSSEQINEPVTRSEEPTVPECETETDSFVPASMTVIPGLAAGDGDFSGNGPWVKVNVHLGTSLDKTLIRIVLYMEARETSGDNTIAEGIEGQNVYVAPAGWKIQEILTEKNGSIEYTDTDHALDIFDGDPRGPVKRFLVFGDNKGTDVGRGNQPGLLTGANIEFNPISVLLVEDRGRNCSDS